MGLVGACRAVGGACLFGLYLAAAAIDHWLFAMAGVRVSVIELLILVSTLAQCGHLVRSALKTLLCFTIACTWNCSVLRVSLWVDFQAARELCESSRFWHATGHIAAAKFDDKSTLHDHKHADWLCVCLPQRQSDVCVPPQLPAHLEQCCCRSKKPSTKCAPARLSRRNYASSSLHDILALTIGHPHYFSLCCTATASCRKQVQKRQLNCLLQQTLEALLSADAMRRVTFHARRRHGRCGLSNRQ